MRIWLLPLLAGTLHAAVIRGTVVENLSGRPVSRASVLLEPVPGSSGTRATVHSDNYGTFVFNSEPAGVYILQATRAPFMTAYYGQKRWNSAGMPLAVSDSETTFVTIRMMRYAAISGTVVDENDVGQSGFTVAAYLDTRPVQLTKDATADERGVFRIYGLLPGNYIVRSLGHELEGIGYKPTFGHETDAVEEARVVGVEMEQEAHEMDIRPIPGKLYTLSVLAKPLDPEDATVTMTFVSEMTRQVVKGEGLAHTFTALPSGDYEVFAEAPSKKPGVKQSNYQRVSLRGDTAITMQLREIPAVFFQLDGLPMRADSDGSLKLLGRRKDLAGWHDQQVIHLENHRANLTIGPWEFALTPPDGYYVSGFSGPGPLVRNQRPEGWNEAIVNGGGSIRFSVSGGPSSLHGAVNDGGNPVVGAPVFLESMDLELARRITNTYVTVTDVHGQYRFGGLPPGHYRVLSSFEYQMPDSDTMVLAGAKDLQIDIRNDAALDLDLYVIR